MMQEGRCAEEKEAMIRIAERRSGANVSLYVDE
jgi:hypothetical protein